MNSTRNYKIAMVSGICHAGPWLETVDLATLVEERGALRSSTDYEYLYALQEIIDDVLDLKVGESMYFKPNRDDEKSKGIILRVK